MAVDLTRFALAIDTPLAIPTSQAYRPTSWPPQRDWVCVEDKDGNAVSRWGDPVWDLYPWAGINMPLNFGDGPKIRRSSPVIDPANADLLRLVTTWRIWGPRATPSPNTIRSHFSRLRGIIAFCSDNKILASELSRYPVLIEKLASLITPSLYNTVITDLEMIRDASELLGFEILDKQGIILLKSMQPEYEGGQTEYIPPRIWTYVVTRLKECVDDYITHQKQIEACFQFCLDAYKKNDVANKGPERNPFAPNSGELYLGTFADTARKFKIYDVMGKWVGNELLDTKGITALSSYIALIQYTAFSYVLAFTMMRKKEGISIRRKCLEWHDDEIYGRVPLIKGETTKTDPDDNALWVTSPSVESSILAMTSISRMRLGCIGKWEENDIPYLINSAHEPWSSGKQPSSKVRPRLEHFQSIVSRFKCLFDPKELVITEEDFKIAKAVCPTLNEEVFKVGKPWMFAFHQLRRTLAVNMFADGGISDSSMQLQMKHRSPMMPLYYGRGNSTLHFNDEVRKILINTQYEMMGKKLAELNGERYISPYGDEHKAKFLTTATDGEPVNLIDEGDAQRYERAARQHLINFRQTVLGGCMKNGQCDGDCVTSVGDCAGGDGKSPCANVLFDITRAPANQIRLEGVIKQLESTQEDTPRYRFLEQEKRGLENYFAYIGKQA